MDYKDICTSVAKELDIPADIITYVYRLYWKFIRTTIKELPLKEDLTEEEFSKLRTCFNIPSLGKLTCTYDKYLRAKKRNEYMLKLKERYGYKENKTNVHQDSDYS